MKHYEDNQLLEHLLSGLLGLENIIKIIPLCSYADKVLSSSEEFKDVIRTASPFILQIGNLINSFRIRRLITLQLVSQWLDNPLYE